MCSWEQLEMIMLDGRGHLQFRWEERGGDRKP